MNKSEILSQLDEVRVELEKQKAKLDKLLSTPVWDELIHDELDETVELRYSIAENIYELMDIQRKIILKPQK